MSSNALVTGASRGIGKSIALHLASSGWDLALTARTVQDGETREHSSTLDRSNTEPLPGSLQETAAMVRSSGREVLAVPADLLDPSSLDRAVAEVLERWGHIDLLVNNGRYVGPGHMDHFVDTPMELFRLQFEANVMAPLLLTKLVLPSMLAAGHGTIVNISSEVGYLDPPAAAGRGGWGLGYGMTKGALQRMAGILALELSETGIRTFNVEPGSVLTERTEIDMHGFGLDLSTFAPPAVVGATVAWLTGPGGAGVPNGSTVRAQDVCLDHHLVAGWPVGHSPTPSDSEGA